MRGERRVNTDDKEARYFLHLSLTTLSRALTEIVNGGDDFRLIFSRFGLDRRPHRQTLHREPCESSVHQTIAIRSITYVERTVGPANAAPRIAARHGPEAGMRPKDGACTRLDTPELLDFRREFRNDAKPL